MESGDDRVVGTYGSFLKVIRLTAGIDDGRVGGLKNNGRVDILVDGGRKGPAFILLGLVTSDKQDGG